MRPWSIASPYIREFLRQSVGPSYFFPTTDQFNSRYSTVARGVGQLKRQGRPLQLWVWQKLSLTNILSKTLHDILKFKHICSKRQLKRFQIKIFLAAQSFLIKLCFFWLYDSFPPLFFMTIYRPSPFTVRHQDTRTPLDLRHGRTGEFCSRP